MREEIRLPCSDRFKIFAAIRISKNDEGFTLIELLVALAIFAVLAVLLTQVLHHAIQTIQAATDVAQDSGPSAVRMALNNMLSEARPNIPGGDLAHSRPPLLGGDDAVDFITAYAPSGQYGGLYATSLRLTARSGQKYGDWIIEQTLIRRDSNSIVKVGSPRRSVLLHRVASIKLSYFGRSGPFGEASWLSMWDGMQLPSKVRVEVQLPPGDTRQVLAQDVELPLAN